MFCCWRLPDLHRTLRCIAVLHEKASTCQGSLQRCLLLKVVHALLAVRCDVDVEIAREHELIARLCVQFGGAGARSVGSRYLQLLSTCWLCVKCWSPSPTNAFAHLACRISRTSTVDLLRRQLQPLFRELRLTRRCVYRPKLRPTF